MNFNQDTDTKALHLYSIPNLEINLEKEHLFTFMIFNFKFDDGTRFDFIFHV